MWERLNYSGVHLQENEGKEVGIKVESGESGQDKTPAAEKESDALEKKKE